MQYSEANLLTATALFTRHNERLEAWGISGQDRYNRALARFIAMGVMKERGKAFNELLLKRIAARAKTNEQAIIDGIDDDEILSPDQQEQLYNRIMACRSIAERAEAALVDRYSNGD